jgi:hypothetical protein
MVRSLLICPVTVEDVRGNEAQQVWGIRSMRQ